MNGPIMGLLDPLFGYNFENIGTYIPYGSFVKLWCQRGLAESHFEMTTFFGMYRVDGNVVFEWNCLADDVKVCLADFQAKVNLDVGGWHQVYNRFLYLETGEWIHQDDCTQNPEGDGSRNIVISGDWFSSCVSNLHRRHVESIISPITTHKITWYLPPLQSAELLPSISSLDLVLSPI